jgi:hypothetical protein
MRGQALSGSWSSRSVMPLCRVHTTLTCRLQAMQTLSSNCSELMEELALDVMQELRDSYPEELRRVALRDIKHVRPTARDRWILKSTVARKFVHLTPGQRYTRAQFHASVISRVMRLADCLLAEHLLDLIESSLQVSLTWSLAKCTLPAIAYLTDPMMQRPQELFVLAMHDACMARLLS